MAVKAVLDCMLFLQAVTNERGVAFKCFQLAEERRIDLVVCRGIINGSKRRSVTAGVDAEIQNAYFRAV